MAHLIRRAVLADAPALGEVHVLAWQQAYRHLFPPEALASLSATARADRWREIIAQPDDLTHVVEVNGRLVGFADAGPSRDADAPQPLELYSIYVLADHHGTGAGQELLEAVLGGQAASLWVAEDNPRAHAFYRRNGFAPDGTRKVEPCFGYDLAEIRMVRPNRIRKLAD